MDNSRINDLIRINKEQMDSLILFYRRKEEIKRTRFYKYYNQHPVATSIRGNLNPFLTVKISDNLLEDENDEFLRSFVALMRLFTLDNDFFSLRYLGENFFKENDGQLFNLYPVESKLFNELRRQLNKYLNSPPNVKITHVYSKNSYSFKTNREMFQSIAYGGLIHSNRDKIQKYYAFNLRPEEGKNALVYPLYRGYIIQILLFMTKVIDLISKKVIIVIIRKNINSLIKVTEELINKASYEEASSKLRTVLYILDHIEDNPGRFEIAKKLVNIYELMDDKEKANVYKNLGKDIKRVLDGLPPDFSDYEFSAKFDKHK